MARKQFLLHESEAAALIAVAGALDVVGTIRVAFNSSQQLLAGVTMDGTT